MMMLAIVVSLFAGIAAIAAFLHCLRCNFEAAEAEAAASRRESDQVWAEIRRKSSIQWINEHPPGSDWDHCTGKYGCQCKECRDWDLTLD